MLNFHKVKIMSSPKKMFQVKANLGTELVAITVYADSVDDAAQEFQKRFPRFVGEVKIQEFIRNEGESELTALLGSGGFANFFGKPFLGKP
jgi:hypothetical protein